MLLRLPDELILLIAASLPFDSAIAMAISSVRLYALNLPLQRSFHMKSVSINIPHLQYIMRYMRTVPPPPHQSIHTVQLETKLANQHLTQIPYLGRNTRTIIADSLPIQPPFITILKSRCPHIESFHFYGCFTLPNRALSLLTSHYLGIQHLNLSYCQAVDDHTLQQTLPQLVHLKGLWLSGMHHVSNRTIAYIAQHCNHLTILDLSYCRNIGKRSISALATHCPKLRILNLTNCRLVPEHSICNIARKCTALYAIFLSGCSQIGNNAVKALATHCSNLRQIQLAMCKKVGAKSLHTLLSRNTSLTNLDISHGNWLTHNHLRQLKHLTTINLSACYPVYNSMVRTLANNAPYLCAINVSATLISDNGFIHIIKACQHLKILAVNACYKLSDYGIRILTQAPHHVEELQIRGCYNINSPLIWKILQQPCSTIELIIGPSGMMFTPQPQTRGRVTI